MKMKQLKSLICCCVCVALMIPALAAPASANFEGVGTNGKKTILVLSAHCDDEMNIAHSVIKDNVDKGNNVYVINIIDDTNRRGESKNALQTLGLPEENYIYMGLKDVIHFGANTLPFYDMETRDTAISGAPLTRPWEPKGGGTVEPSWSSLHMGGEVASSINGIKSVYEDVIETLRPDEIYAIDQDEHTTHMGTSYLMEEVIAKVLQENVDYNPRVYKAFAYATGWLAPLDFDTRSPDDTTRNYLKSTVVNAAYLDESGYVVDGRKELTTYSWDSRVRFPVPDGLNIATSENILFQTMACYPSQIKTQDEIVRQTKKIANGDKVFWERETRSIAYEANIAVSSNDGTKARLHDFKLSDKILENGQGNVGNGTNANYTWMPMSTDQEKTVTLSWEQTYPIQQVTLYDDRSLENQITQGELRFYQGNTLVKEQAVGELNDYGEGTEIRLPAAVTADRVVFQILDGKGNLGLSELEVLQSQDILPRPDEFIKIYLDNDSDDFIYTYPVSSATAHTIPLGVYRYPGETTRPNYSWEIVGAKSEKVTISQDGMLRVEAGAPAGLHQIKVTDQTTSLSDTVRISVDTDFVAPPTSITTQAEFDALRGQKITGDYRLETDVAMGDKKSITSFSGSFDGNGYTVTVGGNSIFGAVAATGATIKNLNVTFEGVSGRIAPETAAVVNLMYLGGGQTAAPVLFDNVHVAVTGAVASTGKSVAGMVGNITGFPTTFSNCSVTLETGGSLAMTGGKADDACAAGGFVGCARTTATTPLTIQNSYVYLKNGSSITSTYPEALGGKGYCGAGGFVGAVNGRDAALENCYAIVESGASITSDIDATQISVAGAGAVAGVLYGGKTARLGVTNSYVAADGTILHRRSGVAYNKNGLLIGDGLALVTGVYSGVYCSKGAGATATVPNDVIELTGVSAVDPATYAGWTFGTDAWAQCAGVSPAKNTAAAYAAWPFLNWETTYLTGISVTTPPTKLAYTAGETFDSTGMEVTASYNDGTSKPVTVAAPTTALTAGDTAVTVSYTDGGVTRTTTVAITVNPAPAVEEFVLSVRTEKDDYRAGDTFTAEVYLNYPESAVIDLLNAQITYNLSLTCTAIAGATGGITGDVRNGKISFDAASPEGGLVIAAGGTKIATITFTVGALTEDTSASIGFNAAGCEVRKVGADGALLTPTVTGKTVSLMQYTGGAEVLAFGVTLKGMQLVKMIGTPGVNKVYAVDGTNLFQSATEGVYVGFVKDSYTNDTIGAAVRVVDGTAETIDYSGDIDGSGEVLSNDGRIVYNLYNGGSHQAVIGDKAYLALDVNGDFRVDIKDVIAIVQAFLR